MAYARTRGFKGGTLEDVVQKIFETAWRRFAECKNSEEIWKLWIFRIAENTCGYELKKLKRRGESLVADYQTLENLAYNREQSAHAASPVETQMNLEEIDRRLEQFVVSLPAKQREVFLMRMNDMTYEQIGHALSITTEAARRRMQKAIDAGYSSFADMLN